MNAQHLAASIQWRLERVDSFRLALAGIPQADVMDECLSVATFYGSDLEELGTSDVSCMARSVIAGLGRSVPVPGVRHE